MKRGKRPRAAVGFKNCCEYVKTKQGIITQCGYRAPYRKGWNYCPYCGEPIVVLFNDDDAKE